MWAINRVHENRTARCFCLPSPRNRDVCYEWHLLRFFEDVPWGGFCINFLVKQRLFLSNQKTSYNMAVELSYFAHNCYWEICRFCLKEWCLVNAGFTSRVWSERFGTPRFCLLRLLHCTLEMQLFTSYYFYFEFSIVWLHSPRLMCLVVFLWEMKLTQCMECFTYPTK